ncbi:MAG TPA: glycosyltransferase family 2 protein [Solirubrobacterales bacterium]|nr:glycosyltransferase family 2 protein [Solirubrobacterales bacterium]
MIVVEIAFWVSVALIVWTHVGYPLALLAVGRLGRGPREAQAEHLPEVSLIIAAHDEEAVIEAKVANALALDYPRDQLEVIVASDGSTDRTVELARAAGADLVLDLRRAGKVPAQNAAAEQARGEVLAFSDANAIWESDALGRLVAPFADPQVGYVCGQAQFTRRAAAGGTANEEGAYWRLELKLREAESRLAGVTGGNGAIYAVRSDAYVPLGPAASHDLSFPFLLTKAGWRCLYVPEARAEEPMVATIEGEFARKRRMMRGIWDEVVRDGMLSPRGYGLVYGWQIASHRVLRYASPALHLVALGANVALAGDSAVYALTLAGQLGLLAAAALAGALPLRPLRLARYYVLTTASIAAGLWDRIRLGTPGAWEKAEGTR